MGAVNFKSEISCPQPSKSPLNIGIGLKSIPARDISLSKMTCLPSDQESKEHFFANSDKSAAVRIWISFAGASAANTVIQVPKASANATPTAAAVRIVFFILLMLLSLLSAA